MTLNVETNSLTSSTQYVAESVIRLIEPSPAWVVQRADAVNLLQQLVFPQHSKIFVSRTVCQLQDQQDQEPSASLHHSHCQQAKSLH